jgi:hypothetical protein
MQYTPGEWIAEGCTIYALNDNGYNRFDARVQRGYTDDAKTSESELEANATLIAAAPNLAQKLYEADQLIMQLATTIIKAEVMNHVPFGLQDKCNQWLRDGATSVLSKAGYSR